MPSSQITRKKNCAVPENIRTHPIASHWKFRGGGGGGGGDLSTGKLYKGKYEAKLEIPGGWKGSNEKFFPWGRYGYFLELHIF